MGLKRAGALARDGAGGVHEEAGHQALRRGATATASSSGSRGHLPQQGRRGDRAPRPGRRRDRLAHLHGRRARLLRVRRRLDRHGQRLVHARRPRHRPRDGALRPARASSAPGVTAKDVMLYILSQPFFKSGRGHRQGARVRGRRASARWALDERATLDEHGGRGGRASPGSSRRTRSSSTTS